MSRRMQRRLKIGQQKSWLTAFLGGYDYFFTGVVAGARIVRGFAAGLAAIAARSFANKKSTVFNMPGNPPSRVGLTLYLPATIIEGVVLAPVRIVNCFARFNLALMLGLFIIANICVEVRPYLL